MKNRLLVIEDNPDHQVILKNFLETAYEIEMVSNASAGLEKQSQQQYDMVLVDFQLGDMTGLDFIRLVRESGQEYPILLMSSKMSLELDLKARKAGGNFCINKEDIFRQKNEFFHLIEYLLQVARRQSRWKRLAGLYTQILENFFLPLALVEKNGRILVANQKFRRILGVSSEELVGNKLPRFVEKSDRPRLMLLMKQAFLGDETDYFPFQMWQAQNQWVETYAKGHPVLLRENVPWILLEIQEKPSFLEGEVQDFLHWLRDVRRGLAVIDSSEQIIFWNAEASEIFRLPEFRGQTLPLDQLLHMESVRELRRHVNLQKDKKQLSKPLKLELRNRFGESQALYCHFVGGGRTGRYMVIRTGKSEKLPELGSVIQETMEMETE